MQWLLHGKLSPVVAEALRARSDCVHQLSELELPADATPVDILKVAKARQWDIMTDEPAMSHAPFDSDFAFDRSIVFLQLAGGDVEQDDAVERLFKRYRRLSPRHLYTVTETRVKTRQLPGRR